MFELAFPIRLDDMNNFKHPGSHNLAVYGKSDTNSCDKLSFSVADQEFSGVDMAPSRTLPVNLDPDKQQLLQYSIHSLNSCQTDWVRDMKASSWNLMKPFNGQVNNSLPEKALAVASDQDFVQETNSANSTTCSGALQRRKLGVNREKRAWSYESTVLLLQCAKEMLHCELKEITRVVSTRLYKRHGGRAAEKKLKRLVQFDNWRQCDKSEVAERIDLLLKVLKADNNIVDSKLLAMARKVRPTLFR